MFDFALLNVWAWLGASALGLVIGFLWYSPFLFGNMWMKAKKLSKKDCKHEDMWKSMLGQFVANLVFGYVLFGIFMLSLVGTMQDALMLGAWLWLGFMATQGLSCLLWSKEKSWTVFLIDAGQNLVLMLAMGAVLFQWGYVMMETTV